MIILKFVLKVYFHPLLFFGSSITSPFNFKKFNFGIKFNFSYFSIIFLVGGRGTRQILAWIKKVVIDGDFSH
jgi:hypothetical protein